MTANNTTSPSLPLYWHPDIALHDHAAEHVAMHEQRLGLIAAHLLKQPWAREARPSDASMEALGRVHSSVYLELLATSVHLGDGEHYAFDRETRMNRQTWRTLSLSVGAWLDATRQALDRRVPAAFCVSYAGHHARHNSAAGFCFVNGVAVAAHEALARGAERVAVIDFDTHAGDGTVLSVLDEPRVLFAETYQPGFPGAFLNQPTREGILRFKTDFAPKFHEYWTRIFERIRAYDPELVLVSAGFDAHAQDPLTRIKVSDEAYSFLGRELAALPCPVVCGLEGGYNLDSTRRAAALFCAELARKMLS